MPYGNYGGYGHPGGSYSSNQSNNASSGSSSGSSSSFLVPGAQADYGQLLAMNEQNYKQLLPLYSQGQAAIGQGVGAAENTLGLGGALGGSNWGVAQPAATAIQQQFAATGGQIKQGLASSGLGNSTMLGNMENQNTLFEGQALGGLGAQLAQTAAGYQMQGLGMGNQLTQGLLGNLAGYRFGNTAGNLLGTQSANQSLNNTRGSSGGNQGSPAGGGRGGYGGGGSSGNPVAGAGGGFGGGFGGGAGLPSFGGPPVSTASGNLIGGGNFGDGFTGGYGGYGNYAGQGLQRNNPGGTTQGAGEGSGEGGPNYAMQDALQFSQPGFDINRAPGIVAEQTRMAYPGQSKP
jgi:hypothetical protein